MPCVTFVVGTVPEIIKSIDVARQLALSGFRVMVYDTLQNRADAFDRPEDVEIVRASVVRRECRDDMDWIACCATEIAELAGDVVVVQGDTFSALAGAHGAVRAGATLAHIEAGLRSHDPLSPFPEEMNRVFIDTQSDLLFCATETDYGDLDATVNLSAKQSFVVGNTVCDAIFRHRKQLIAAAARPDGVLISLHRRENRQHSQIIIEALARLVAEFPGTEFRLLKRGLLAHIEAADLGPNAVMVGTTEHLHFLEMLAGSQMAICDSGGILEEAVTLGVPVICLRHTLERGRLVEGVDCIDPAKIGGFELRALVNRFLSQPVSSRSALRETFGNGRSAERIAELLEDHFAGLLTAGKGTETTTRPHRAVLVAFDRSKPVERSNHLGEAVLDERLKRYAGASGADTCEP
ncbi:UDP-N-acetylglucosamine 2-epimerase [Bradyrhizobium sp. OK095]|jgi:UDP-N-acetylglucosamine 2-epimerase (non-hydrolysing)|uniref:UDP-N-acetylglucosamine 2-epimerase n=1 Tax=Bradyrhizobium sp. OK095 TaxID=1882760 RepID=UPI0008AC080E|nr:UDP-N-acetylglucosamine 2-epimerase [Bradyrhizobium sp. OK095]SEN76672.1 UDP-N-acetylglucosamine 2-epimerase (non-hydrolysing) [Bradyrhizobium sp. OK095]